MHSGPQVTTGEVKIEAQESDLLAVEETEAQQEKQQENRIKAVIAALNFDRATLRVSKAELVSRINDAKNLLAEIPLAEAHPDSVLIAYATELAKQIGIYYGYHLRNPDLAIQHFNIYKQLAVPGSLDQVRANMYLSYAGTIRGNYHDRTLFDKALIDLNSYQQKLFDEGKLTQEKILEINIEQGYIECFLGLVIHRKSYLTPGIGELDRIACLKDAIQHLRTGQALQEAALELTKDATEEKLVALNTQVLIELPNTYHIESICHAKIPQRDLEIVALNKAIALEKGYKVKTGNDHFLLYVSGQNHALTTGLYFGVPQQALLNLQQVLQGQQEFFKDAATGEYTDNLDIAKTHHFMGQILVKLGRYEEAIRSFHTAFDMKVRLGVPMLAFDMIDTQTCMLNAISELRISGVDNVNYLPLMLNTVNKVLKLDWNLHNLFDGFKSLMKPLVPVVDFLLQYLPRYAPALQPQLLQKQYELGAYYNHLKRSQPFNAFDYLNPALEYCDANKDKVDTNLHHWIINHIAFTYHQELAQSFGKDIAYLRNRYARYEQQPADDLNEQQIREYFYAKAMEAADRTIRFVSTDALTQSRIRAFGHLISAYNKYERQRYMSNKADKIKELADVVAQCGVAISLYIEQQDFQEQYLRANNRYADLISEYVALLNPENDHELIAALPAPIALYEANKEKRKELKTEAGNPFAGRGYFSEAKYRATKTFKSNANDADFLSLANMTHLQKAIDTYAKAHEILAVSEGPKDGFALDALKLKLSLQIQLASMVDSLNPETQAELIAQLPKSADLYESVRNEARKHGLESEFASKLTPNTALLAQKLDTGSTTGKAGLYAGSARAAEEEKKAAAAALAQQQLQTKAPSMSQSLTS